MLIVNILLRNGWYAPEDFFKKDAVLLGYLQKKIWFNNFPKITLLYEEI